ncbi:hypothetical protein KC347_g7274 [Hortaea werneckii]|nr:hypothetical protein KC347_g7274 [Hortaea werneckii]
MAGNIDPRLGASLPPPQYAPVPLSKPPGPPPPPAPPQPQQQSFGAPYTRADGLPVNAGPPPIYHHQSPPQPYYNYPSPSTNPTPQQPGPAGSGLPSQHASPSQIHYAAPPHLDQPNTSPGDFQGGEDGGQNPDDPKRPRACEACRGLKVRCDQDPAHPEIPCKRCAKAGRQCIITQPTRKRQKKADSRVAELEKKLDALTAALHQQNAQQGQQYAGGLPQSGTAPQADMMGRSSLDNDQMSGMPYPQGSVEESLAALDPTMRGQKRRRVEDEDDGRQAFESSLAAKDESLAKGFDDIEQAWAPNKDVRGLVQSPDDFVTRINSLIDPATAADMFNRYCRDLAPHLPAVVFPPETTAEQVFRDRPILYVCILSASSFGILPHDISKHLAREAVGAIADCVVRNGAKSLELIQAMQVLALYYKPPEENEQTNFYQIIHMAAVMALDIGLGKRFNPSKARRGFGGPQNPPGMQRTMPQDSDTLEARRAWLTCYYLCASASMVLRRPNLVRWTKYMKECIEVLESHPEAFPSDRLFCQHVKIQHICEDIGLQFLMDDNTANVSITDPKVTYALNVLEAQLKQWKENIPADCRGKGLEFFEHVTSLYLHEIALHFNHNIEDFRLPFTEESLKSMTTTNSGETLTQNQMAALEACLRAAQGILDTLMSYDAETVRGLPMLLYFVRCVYAIVILIKMHVAVCTPNSELGKMMRPEDLRVEYYIDGLIALFRQVTGEGEASRPHPKILKILGTLKEWFEKHKELLTGVPTKAEGTDQQQQPPPQQTQQHSHQNMNQVDDHQQQTPLHLLSQVATGNQRQQHQAGEAPNTDWTFNTPTMVDYSKQAMPGNPDASMPLHVSRGGPPQVLDNPPMMPQDQAWTGIVDPTNQDYGWGSGFEQAMDIALGGIDGMQGAGLDNWFLGDSMAPFVFQGDASGTGGQMAGGGQIVGPGW